MSETSTSQPRARSGVRTAASGAASRAQLARLFRLVVTLQSERYPNARELAELCEVSRRTIHRDLELLAAAEIPVRYRPERQGYHLARGFFLPPPGLTEPEALGLKVLAGQWRAGDALGLLRPACEGGVKIMGGLPAEVRERVRAASELFRTRESPEPPSPDRKCIQAALLDALTRQKQLRLWYRDAATMEGQCTKLGVYRVVFHERHWFLVGRSSLHRRVVVIGEPWVSRAEVTDDPSAIPPRFSLERFLGRAWGVERGSTRYDVRLRFSERVTPLVLGGVWHASQRAAAVGGRAELTFEVDGLDEILKWILGFGDDVEVLQPEELRDRVRSIATRLARAHQTPVPVDPPAGGPG